MYHDHKKFIPRTPPWQIQSPQCTVNEKIPKIFDLKFSMTKKSWCPDHSIVNYSESRALCKWKNFEKLLTSNLVWQKKVGAWK